jgi:trigger factor
MNFTLVKSDELNAVLKLTVEKADYNEKVSTALKNYRKNINIKGFRPGTVPMQMVQKLYGKPAMVEVVNKLVSDNLFKYIQDEKLHILGEPLPSTEQAVVDFETQEDFEFAFDLGFAPAIDLTLDKKTSATYYNIVVSDELVNTTIENHARRFGEQAKVDVIDGSEIVKGSLAELNDGKLAENGLGNQSASLYLGLIKDEEVKKLFIGKKIDEAVDFNLRKAYPNDTEISTLLNITKEEAEANNSDFRFVVSEILRFTPAAINQELFDKVLGADEVEGEEEFRARIKSDLGKDYQNDSDLKFKIDLKDILIEKTKIELPSEFLKRWLAVVNEEKPEVVAKIDDEFPDFAKYAKWELIRNKMVKDEELKVTQDEIYDYAKTEVAMQFARYGYALSNIPNEYLEGMVDKQLEKEEEKRRILESLLDLKIAVVAKSKLNVEVKDVTVEEFNKLFESQED